MVVEEREASQANIFVGLSIRWDALRQSGTWAPAPPLAYQSAAAFRPLGTERATVLGALARIADFSSDEERMLESWAAHRRVLEQGAGVPPERLDRWVGDWMRSRPISVLAAALRRRGGSHKVGREELQGRPAKR